MTTSVDIHIAPLLFETLLPSRSPWCKSCTRMYDVCMAYVSVNDIHIQINALKMTLNPSAIHGGYFEIIIVQNDHCLFSIQF